MRAFGGANWHMQMGPTAERGVSGRTMWDDGQRAARKQSDGSGGKRAALLLGRTRLGRGLYVRGAAMQR